MNSPGASHQEGATEISHIKVCFPVNYLGFGGAERQLVDLVLGLDKGRFEALVVTLQPGGPLESELEFPGIEAGSKMAEAETYREPFRIDSNPSNPNHIEPGDLTQGLSVPWQADFS